MKGPSKKRKRREERVKLADLKHAYPLRAVLIALILLSASAGAVYGAYTWYITTFQIGFQELVTNQQAISITVLGGTNYTEPEMLYCQLNSAGKALTVHFQLLNSTSQLGLYFNQFNVSVRVSAIGFLATTKTWYTGASVIAGQVVLTSTVSTYQCYVTIAYSAKPGVSGTIDIALGIAAEQTP